MHQLSLTLIVMSFENMAPSLNGTMVQLHDCYDKTIILLWVDLCVHANTSRLTDTQV